MTRRIGPATWIALALIACTIFIYWDVRHFAFVNWDDGDYVTDNAHVLAGLSWSNVTWALTTGHSPYWHPLTWLSHMLDVSLYGTAAGGPHVTNVILASANAVALFLLLRHLTGSVWRSAFVSAMFAVHPLRVESVAWIAERKDLLSTFFLFLTIGAYARYTRAPGVGRYALLLAVFALGLMAKPMLVTLPFALLLLDVWPLGRTRDGTRRRKLFIEKAPMLALAVGTSVVTLLVQRHIGAVATLDVLPLTYRIANATVSYVSYLGLTIWPVHLAAFYPYPHALPPIWMVTAAAVVLALVSVAVVRRRARHPYLLSGWFWYVITLGPVIGIVQSGDQLMANRFTYVPLLGIFIIVAWGLPDVLARWQASPKALAVAAALAIVACTITARHQAAFWKNSDTLWTRALAVTTDNYRAQKGLADALVAENRYTEAIQHYQEALRIAPASAASHNNLGLALTHQNRLDEAIAQYRVAVDIDPSDPEPHNNLGATLARTKRTGPAIEQYVAALHLDANFALAHNNLGLALNEEGRAGDAIRECLEALRLEPSNADWHYEVGVLFYRVGNHAEAMEHLQTALQLRPDFEAARQAIRELSK